VNKKGEEEEPKAVLAQNRKGSVRKWGGYQKRYELAGFVDQNTGEKKKKEGKGGSLRKKKKLKWLTLRKPRPY